MADESFHRAMLSRAIELSKKAVENPVIYEPYGAVIVRISDLTVIGEGCNNTREEMDPTLHGEVRTCKILHTTDVSWSAQLAVGTFQCCHLIN